MTKVSVALATYNGARFLRPQLDSLARQTVLPAELVVCDDASADDTVAIVEAFAAEAPFPVHLHRQPARLGYRGNFMSAIGRCTADVIALCDQDDIWLPVKLEQCLSPFVETDVLACFHEAWLIDSAGTRSDLAKIYKVPAVNPPLTLFPMRNAFGFTLVVRRGLLQFSDLWDRSVDNLATDDPMAHDQWLFFLASVLGTIVHLDEPLAEYRQHETNAYGVGRTTLPFRRRLGATVARVAAEFASFGVAARARADILDAIAERTDGAWHSRARDGAASYRQFSYLCLRRASVHADAGVGARLAAWRGALRTGLYTETGRWVFRPRAALRDLAFLFVPRRGAADEASARGAGAPVPSGPAD